MLSGVAVDDRLVLQLAGLVDPTLGTRLVTAYRLRARVVTLTSGEQQAILTALEDEPAASLREIRDAFLNSETWPVRERLQ
jgi:hypothetical protein